jgi:hypothetical protein
MNESPELKYSRLQAEIQRAILHNYPNPDRRGCPSAAVVREIARRPDELTAKDDNDERSVWFHVTHCSPCYANFLELRFAGRAHQQKRFRILRRLAFATAVAVVVVLGWVLWLTMTGRKTI